MAPIEGPPGGDKKAVAKPASVARAVGALFLTGLVMATSLGDPATVAAASAPSQRDMLGWLRTLGAPVEPLLEVSGTNAITKGSDGRLTVLVMGSDTRNSGIGLTDVVMVASIEGHAISLASIPRDTGKFPNPSGGTYVGKVNNLPKKIGFDAFERAVEYALNIEIDYRVMVTFRGFETLVNEIGSVFPKNRIAIKDPKFWDDPNKAKGVYFPAAPSGYSLQALPAGPLCNGLWKNYSNPPSSTWCRRALPFVRSRKGPGNSDFLRNERQQNFLFATIKAVGSGELDDLSAAARGQVQINQVRTNLPTDLGSITSVYNTLAGSTLAHRVVFAPSYYATRIPGTSSYQLKLTTVRSWTNSYMR